MTRSIEPPPASEAGDAGSAIVERLRALAKKWGQGEGRNDGRLAIADEAADLILALQAEVREARETALEQARVLNNTEDGK